MKRQSHRKMATQSYGSKADAAKTARLPIICYQNAFGWLGLKAFFFVQRNKSPTVVNHRHQDI